MPSQINPNVYVKKERYLEIIGFTSYAYLTGKISKYSGMAGGRMRTLGEFIENFVYGKVAEEAFKNFLKRELSIDTLTEIDIADFYLGTYLPDITAIESKGEYLPLKFWVDVKETRRGQKWLLVPSSSIRERPYDAYVAVWVDLPQDHMLWLVSELAEIKNKMSPEWLKRAADIAEKIESIPCLIQGFVTVAKLVNSGTYFDGNTPLFDPDDPAWRGAIVGENHGYFLKTLTQESSWDELKEMLTNNEKKVPHIPLPTTKSGKISKKSGLPETYRYESDYRDAFQKYFEDQLKEIKNRYGSIKREESWFSQKL